MREQTKMLIAAFTICACVAFLIAGEGSGDLEASDDLPDLNAELFLTGPDTGLLWTDASVAGTVLYKYSTEEPTREELIEPPVPDSTWKSFTVSSGEDYTDFRDIPEGYNGLWMALKNSSGVFGESMYVWIPDHYLIAEPDELVGGGMITFTSDVPFDTVSGTRQTTGEGSPTIEATGSGTAWSTELPNESATYIFRGYHDVDVGDETATMSVSCVVFVTHSHIYPIAWSSDENGHWHECACGDVADESHHTSSGAATTERAETCTVCGYEIAPKLTGYTVTLKTNRGSDEPDMTIRGVVGKYVLPQDPPFEPKQGYVLIGWSLDPEGPTLDNIQYIHEDCTYYAIWNTLSYGFLTYGWVVEGESVEVTGFMQNMEQDMVDVPSEITVDGNTYRVIGIESGAFYQETGITKASIAEGVGYIGLKAFDGCTGLREVTLSTGLEDVGMNAFSDCTNLREIVLPSGVTTIGEYAFKGCTGLTRAVIPSGITDMGYGIFGKCSKLITIDLSNGLSTIGDGMFSDCTSLKRVDLPSSITTIGKFAFANCTELYWIVLPSGVTAVGEHAFQGCVDLKDINVPDTVTDMGKWMFQYCTGLTKVWLPARLDAIPEGTFAGCTSLTGITIPSGVTTIGVAAFEGCTSLRGIDIPSSVTTIGGYAFKDCTSLAEVTIPASVTGIGISVFYGCTGLEGVALEPGARIIGEAMFTGCTSLTEMIIPASVMTIGTSAFKGCTSLTGVSFMSLVTPGSEQMTIGGWAFQDCGALTSIMIPSNVTTIGTSAFEGCTGLRDVFMYTGLSVIRDLAFKGCSDITSLTIPPSVGNIGNRTFEDCTRLMNVTIEYYDEKPKVDEMAFEGTNANVAYKQVLRPASGLTWTGLTATWAGVDGATYEVQLTDKDGNVVETVTSDTTSYDFSDRELIGHYGFKVTTIKDDMRSETIWCYDKAYFTSGSMDLGEGTTGTIVDDSLVIDGHDSLNGKTIDASDTEIVTVRLPEDAITGSADMDDDLTVIYPHGVSATITGSGMAAATDSLYGGENLGLTVVPVDSETLFDDVGLGTPLTGKELDAWAAILVPLSNYDGLDEVRDAVESLTLPQLVQLHEYSMELEHAVNSDPDHPYADRSENCDWLETYLFAIIEEKKESLNLSDITIEYSDGTSPIFLTSIRIDTNAITSDGSSRGIVLHSDDSNAFEWSSMMPNANFFTIGPTGSLVTEGIKAYKVLDDGSLEARTTKVTMNADGTAMLSAFSNSNSTYVFVYDPTVTSGDADHNGDGNTMLWIGIGAVIAILAVIGVAMVVRNRT